MGIRSTGEDAYFAASNSTAGFISYYEEVFRASRIGHIWAVKGGPGTGKSRFFSKQRHHTRACNRRLGTSSPRP